MKLIDLKSYAKVNLALDVLGRRPDGYHELRMVMQQTALADDVCVRWISDGKADAVAVEVHTNKYYIPTDRRNTAYGAAEVMADRFGAGMAGTIRVDIKKKVPVAAGLAGGSGNGAAVIHGLNKLWGLGLSVRELCGIAAEIGADMPFCVMGQAKSNIKLGLAKDPLAATCALAEGTGTELTPLPPLDSYLILSKPPLSVSTKEVYKAIDRAKITARPDVDALVSGLRSGEREKVTANMCNVLEFYTLKAYNPVLYTKNKMRGIENIDTVLMSGSGPTIYGLAAGKRDAEKAGEVMKKINKETFVTRTML